MPDITNTRATDFVAQQQAVKDKYGAYEPGLVARPEVDAAAPSSGVNFPAPYFKAPAGYEDKLEAYQFMKEKMDVQLTASPDKFILDAMKQKRDSEQLIKFDEWIMNKFDLTDPLVVKHLKSLYPEYFALRYEVVKGKLANLEKFARIEMFGPETMEDIRFQFLYQNGQIEVPIAVVDFVLGRTDAANGELDVAAERTFHFNRGLFNKKNPKQVRVIGYDGKEKATSKRDGFDGPGWIKPQPKYTRATEAEKRLFAKTLPVKLGDAAAGAY